MVGEQNARDLEEVAEAFAEALVASYRKSSRAANTVLAPDPELTHRFCNAVVAYLDARARSLFAATDGLDMRLMDEERAPMDERRALVDEQESVAACMDFLGEMFAYYVQEEAMTAHYEGSGEAAEMRLQSSRRSRRTPPTQEGSGA